MQNLLYIFSFSFFSLFSFLNVPTTENLPPECAGENGQLKMLYWNNLPTTNLSILYHHVYYPQSPDGILITDDLDLETYFNDKYGALIRGYIVAPETGDYLFNLTTDDKGDFKLSTDDQPENLVLIANTTGATGTDDHVQYDSQTSDTIPLVAGDYYYFELTWKENTGNDYAKVYWNIPSTMDDSWTIIESSHFYDYTCATICNPLGTPCDDGDADTQNDIEDGSCNCLGQPAISNNCIGERGRITALYYDGLDGSNLIHMDTASIFPNSPTRAEHLKDFRGPLSFSGDYGAWVKTYLTVPMTGKYVFNITGDNETKLWLSSSESDDPNDLTVIGHVTNNTLIDQHDRYESQTSDSIDLIKGQYYYMELKMKENGGNDFYNVYWKAPFLTDTTWQIVTGALLHQYTCETACTPAGITCDDGDNSTINDLYDENCDCVGTPCLTEDCNGNQTISTYEICNLTEQHSNQVDSWQSCEVSQNPYTARGIGHWIKYDLNDIYKIHDTHIWNYNKTNETGKGIQDVVIDVSLDGISWSELGTYTWPQATGTTDYEGFVGENYNGRAARYVLITALNNWNEDNCSGFSELKMNVEVCPNVNTPCDDGNPNTLDDAYNELCTCVGTPDGSLALDLLSFEANWDKRNVLVEWQIQNEESGTLYEVQRSLDAQHFEAIGVLRGKAVNPSKVAYQLVDTKGYQLANELFYRLKMIENSSREQFSHVVSLRQTDGAARLKINMVQPNPFQESVQIQLTIPNDNDNIQLRVFNGQGQFVKDLVNGQVKQGQYQIAWDGTDNSGKEVEAGIYYLQLTDGTQRIGRRMVKL